MTEVHKPQIFIVEGNIGAGKTTFLKKIEETLPDSQVIYEPVDKWEEIKDKEENNVLQLFYKNPKKYSYLFQSMAFITRFQELSKLDFTKKYIFIERSIYSDKNIFATNCYNTGLMEEIEWKIYNNWFEGMSSFIKFDFKFVYIKCLPETSLFRINQRERTGENSIQLDYLQQLFFLHEKWLNPYNSIVVNGELDFKNDPHTLECIISEITRN